MAEAAREAPREPRELPDEPLTQPLEASRECTVAGEPRRFCEVGDSDTAQKFLTRLTVRARSGEPGPRIWFCDLLEQRWLGVTRRDRSRISNGPLARSNSLSQAVKRRP